jgi:hypothetical protein
MVGHADQDSVSAGRHFVGVMSNTPYLCFTISFASSDGFCKVLMGEHKSWVGCRFGCGSRDACTAFGIAWGQAEHGWDGVSLIKSWRAGFSSSRLPLPLPWQVAFLLLNCFFLAAHLGADNQPPNVQPTIRSRDALTQPQRYALRAVAMQPCIYLRRLLNIVDFCVAITITLL